MSYTDKQLTCSDCGKPFTFGAEEQEFFRAKGKRLPISNYSATIAGAALPSARRSRSSSHRRATPTSRSAARSAERPRSRPPAADVVVDLVPADRCTLRYVRHAVRVRKFRSSLVETDQCIAAHATMPLAAVPTKPGDKIKHNRRLIKGPGVYLGLFLLRPIELHCV